MAEHTQHLTSTRRLPAAFASGAVVGTLGGRIGWRAPPLVIISALGGIALAHAMA